MTEIEKLIARLEKRAQNERAIQANNEAVATALKGQKLLFDQGFRSPSITFAVRLGLDHENCAKNDAALAADWDEAATALRAMQAETERLRGELEAAQEAHIFADAARDAAEAKVREMALDVLASSGQAQEAYEAQLAAEATVASLTAQVEAMRGALEAWKAAGSDEEYYRAVQMRNAALTTEKTNG